jgi:hypothetical protein
MKQYTAIKREEFISSVLLRSGAIASDAGVVSNPTELAKIAIGEAYDRMFDSSALTIINDKISRLEKLGKLTETGKEILRELNGLKSEIQQFPQFTADQLEVIAGNQINTTSVPYEQGFIKGFVNGGLFVQGLPEPSKQEPQQEQVMSGEFMEASDFRKSVRQRFWHTGLPVIDLTNLDPLLNFIYDLYLWPLQKTNAALTHPSPAPQQEVSTPEVEAASNIPDGENDWHIGSETFTRSEVFKMLYTQRAMIQNDLKRSCWDELPETAKDIVLNPRQPKI